MSNKSIVRLHANVTVNGKDWEAFTQMVAEVKTIVHSEGVENVLTHQTYHQSGSFNCLIIEAYKDEQTFLAHLENIKPLSEKYKVDWTVNRMELSGGYSEATVSAMREGLKAAEFIFYDDTF
jgi:quinol monooxygenase YgiN